MKNRQTLINRITKVGIFGALSIILYDFIKFPLPFFPSFLEINFSMLPIILIALAYGPLDACIIVILRFLLKLPLSHTAYVGELGDLIIGILTIIPSSLCYKYNRTKKGGIISLIIAFFIWIIAGTLSNLVTIPIYIKMFYNDVPTLIKDLSMIPGINESNYMIKYLLFGALPFNALVAFIVCLITYLVYKKISIIFKHDFLKSSNHKLKVMVMIDSFKGTLTSKKAGNIVKEELENDNTLINMIPISDGGEGFLEVIKEVKNLEYKTLQVHDAIGRIHQARYLYDKNEYTAYFELAETCGINSLKKEELNPYHASSYGLGEQIKQALLINKIKKIVVGIGGSASSDAGSGMLEALGVRFYDESGKIINNLNNEGLAKVEDIDTVEANNILKNIDIVVLTDVTNPLLGKNGAVYVFSPQKGATPNDLPILEANIKHFVDVIKSKFPNYDLSQTKGDGAAGGVGFAFSKILSATLMSGAESILDLVDFNQICKTYDVIITGEGKFDSQTLNGKIIKGIMQYQPKRLIIVTGISEITTKQAEVYAIVPTICTLEESMRNPETALRKLIKTIKLKWLEKKYK